MQNINVMLDSLAKSKFRGSFKLNKNMISYVNEKGLDKITKDVYEIVLKRIAIYNPLKDGKQTPMKQVHPVFIAQHATGTCCRGCLLKIHNITKERDLNDEEINFIVKLIMTWIKNQIKN